MSDTDPREVSRAATAAKMTIAIVGVLAAGYLFYRASPTRGGAPSSHGGPSSTAAAAPAIGATAKPASVPPPPTSDDTAAAPDAPADTPAEAPQPTAMERVLAAVAASKRAEEAAASLDAPTPPATLEDVISRAMPAVVRVETATGIGTGFFIAPHTLLTNVHVVGVNTTVAIRRRDGRTLTARVDVTAPELDIAIVRISNPEPDQPTLRLGAGASARPGQEVVALGSPLGLQNTVTRGIVSAVRDVGGLTLVQTDAAINPGNSGGPLLDRAGLVIGITTLGVKSSDAQGLSFAVAIEHAQALLAGKRSLDRQSTPLSMLNQAMSGRAAPSAADAGRERGVRAYEVAIAGQAQRADALDERWRAFRRICYQGAVTAVAGREWFALWDAKAMQGTVPDGCAPAFGDVRRVADAIRDGVLAAVETARQADVYPGTRRDVLRRFHLDYPGWDK
jgi:S1-C subfamily serine protease